MVLSITETAALVMSLGAPVLALDTCALLDLIRVIGRTNSVIAGQRCIAAAKQIRAAQCDSPPQVIVVLPPPVQAEINVHRASAVGELNGVLDRGQDALKRLKTVAIGLALPAHPILNIDLLTSNNQKLVALADEIASDAITINDHSDAINRSWSRNASRIAPAARGEAGKDCAVIEHVIELARTVRSQGAGNKIVFMTSNTKDFCMPDRRSPQPPLDTDLSAHDIEMVTNWEWAAATLDI